MVFLMYKGLFFLMSILILGTFGYALYVTGGSDSSYPYVHCPGPGDCRNPLFNSSDCGLKIPSDSLVCTQELVLGGGSFGVEPPFIYKYFWSFILVEIVFVLVLNHLLFNKGFFRGFKLEGGEGDEEENV